VHKPAHVERFLVANETNDLPSAYAGPTMKGCATNVASGQMYAGMLGMGIPFLFPILICIPHWCVSAPTSSYKKSSKMVI